MNVYAPECSCDSDPFACRQSCQAFLSVRRRTMASVSLRHLLHQSLERGEFLLHPLNAHQEELPRTRWAVVRELEGGEHRAMIAPVLVRWAVALLSREDLGGSRPLSGGAGHE